MVDLRRTCPECKRRFRPAKGSPRRFCDTCRPSRSRAPDDPPAISGSETGSDGPGPVASATLAELEAVGRADSAAGRAALWLAGLMDAGRVTGSQAAALADKHLRALEAAKAGARPVADRLDDLAARRRARAESA